MRTYDASQYSAVLAEYFIYDIVIIQQCALILLNLSKFAKIIEASISYNIIVLVQHRCNHFRDTLDIDFLSLILILLKIILRGNPLSSSKLTTNSRFFCEILGGRTK